MDKKLLFTLLATVMVLPLTACERENKNWPDGINNILPVPETENIEVNESTNQKFRADVLQVSKEDYKEYVQECKDMGFTVDYDEDFKGNMLGYYAQNDEKYKLKLSFEEGNEEYTIYLEAPEKE